MSSESSGGSWATWANPSTGRPPTRWVGLAGLRSSGYLLFERDQLGEQQVEFAVADLRLAAPVIKLVVAVDLGRQGGGAARSRREIVTGGSPLSGLAGPGSPADFDLRAIGVAAFGLEHPQVNAAGFFAAVAGRDAHASADRFLVFEAVQQEAQLGAFFAEIFEASAAAGHHLAFVFEQQHRLRALGEVAEAHLPLQEDQGAITQEHDQAAEQEGSLRHAGILPRRPGGWGKPRGRYNGEVGAQRELDLENEKSLVGVVDRVIYANEDNGFAVLRLQVRGQEPVTAVGALLGSQPGETLRLSGEWIRDRKFGKQFRADKAEPVRPQSLKGIERFLGSGLIEGIGETTAKRLVEHFGLATLEVIDKQPERLREVDGIGKVRLGRIAAAWRRQYHLRDLMVFLKTYEVPNGIALKIAKRYGDRALEVVRGAPHQLAREVHGIGFLTADRIARDLGVLPDAYERLAAGLLHVLERSAEQGHTYAPLAELRANAAELLEVAAPLLDPVLAALAERGEVVRVGPVANLFAEPLFQLPALARAEQGLAERLRRLTAQHLLPLDLRTGKAIEWFEERENIELADGQRAALAHALTAKVMVLTGGPGTGKTTLLRGVVEILTRKKLEVQLAAPTGRAAKRLAEATGQEAKTIHRLLEWKPDEHRFLRGPDLPLAADLLVVDEASMLDTQLAFQLLAALKDEARLLFVGDVDQLPSVGPGRVLADLIDSGLVEVERLTEIFRQAARSKIVVNAHRVRDGLLPELGQNEKGGQRPPPREQGADLEGHDFFFIEREDPEEILATLKMLVVERIPQRFGFSALEAIQVLTPMRRGLLGSANLNAELQAALNPDGQGMVGGGHLLRVGDRVMQRRNNYDLGVFNGDVGRVLAFDLQEQRVSIDYDGRTVLYPFADLDELSLAYASSIHKSQGSEYPCVVIPLHTQHFRLLQRNLLYTAITRGRKLVVIVGSRRALQPRCATRAATAGPPSWSNACAASCPSPNAFDLDVGVEFGFGLAEDDGGRGGGQQHFVVAAVEGDAQLVEALGADRHQGGAAAFHADQLVRYLDFGG